MAKHLHYNYFPKDPHKKEIVVTSILAGLAATLIPTLGFGGSMVVGAIGAALVYGGIGTMMAMNYNSSKQREEAKKAAQVADKRAQDIVKKQEKAESFAQQEALQKTQARLASIEGSSTMLTEDMELEEPLIQRKSLLGA